MIILSGYQSVTKLYDSKYSIIYRGYRKEDQLPVIFKLLKKEYPSIEELARFQREYEMTRSLNLEGVIQVYALEKHENSLVMVLEDFEGESLSDILKSQPLSLSEKLQLSIRITHIVGAIHQQHIIHKDINPSNIIWNRNTNQLKFIDFGISTELSFDIPEICNPNILEGTLPYISPEQTGRMNRSVDYRSDLYSLGVTLYKIFTEKLPFSSNDPMELIHEHMARIPQPLHELKATIPTAITHIILQLMQKNAESRYQTAFGLEHDLQHCFDQMKNGFHIQLFQLGKCDISDKFQIPEKLYGREYEIKTLLSAFDQVSCGTTQMMLIAGYSGVGKSALVREIHKPIIAKKGYFIDGKFDQFQRNIPYFAMIHAFQELIQELLREPQEQLLAWKEKLLKSLGCNGQVIIDVIPEVELIIGKQKDVTEVEPEETQNRFNMTFQRFIKVFTQKDHPLVLFLDDLQWADSATLKLLYVLMTDVDSQYLFLIGAYRNNEVLSEHLLMETLERIEKEQEKKRVHTLTLSTLKKENLDQLLSETLHTSVEQVDDLAELVIAKTEGNPFFVNEFLKTLHQEKLLYFDLDKQQWKWDLEKIQTLAITENIVDLMVHKIKKLPQSTQETLQLGACIGSRFQLRTIATISKKSLYQIATDLWPAIQAGLLLVVGDGHQIIQKAGLEIDWGQIPLEFDIEDQFLHDRVQQAAYELIDLGQRKKVHLKTGRLLLESATKDQIEGRVFTIVRQFNEGQELIDSTKEKIRLAELNLDAGKKAKQSTAYRAAAEYLRTGVDLLPKNSWSEHYQLTFELYKEHAECEYLIGNHSIAENRFDLIVENVISKHDQAEIYLLRMVLYFLQNRYTASLRIGLEALQLFGIELPEHPTKEYIQKELVQTRQQQGQIPFSDISRALPICKDKDQEYVIQLLSRMSPAAYLTNPELFSALLIRSTYIAFKHGVTKDSSHSFCGYAIILGGVLGDYSSAYECGKASFELNLKFQNFKFEGRTYMLFSAFINHWKMPFESNLQLHQKGYQTCLDAGDLRFVCYTILFSFWQKWSKSSQLSILKDEYQRHLLFLKKVNDQNTINQTEMFLGMIHSLQTDSVDEKSWNTKTFNEKQYLEKIKQDQYLYGINTYYILKLVMSYLWGDYDDALEYAQKAEETLKASVALLSLTDQCFFYFLTLAKLHENFSEEKQKESTEKRKKLVSQMEIWAENCPENFLHKLQLMQAKEFYLQGDFCESLNHYEKSIEQAKSQDFSRDIALASEECACFWLHQEKEKYARVNFVEAHYLYEQWGATKKAKQLEEKYPDFILLKKDQKNKSQLTISNSTYDGSPKSDYFDFRSVVKASQAISSQMVLSSLLKELMVIAVENAGAQKGLFLIKNNDSFIVKVQENVDHEEIKNGTITFPSSLVQYVFNTQKTLVLENASQDKLFLKDEYIQENSIKSLLCYPILHQGKVTGVLYLENNLLSGAFTPDQIEILDVLSSQAAISIENAQRYNTVEDKVTERTRELKSAQQRIIRLEKDATEVQMAGGFAHEIRNALGGAYSLAEIALYDDSEGTPPKSFCLQNSESLKELYLIIREIIPKEKLRDIAKIIGKINEREETLDEILRRIYDRTDRALGITNQIMEYSRIGKTEKGCDLISLQEVIQSVIDKELEEEFQRQNVNLILSLKPTHPIQGNLLHFHSIIKNLLFNARDAVLDMEDEQRRMIQVNLKETESEQILEVLDRGVGISKEGIDRVFEPFFSTKPETGTGLGLGMVFKFVSLYNGSIDVTSNPEGGETCFTVTLPIKSE